MLIVSLVCLAALGLFLGKRRFLELILLTRASSDTLLDLSKSFSPSALGLGATLNIAMIVTALAFAATRPRVNITLPLLVWVPFLLVTFAAVPGAPEPTSAMRLWLVLVSHAAFFLMPFYLVENDEDLTRAFGLTIIGSLGPTLWAFVQLAFGWAATEDGTRVAGTFSHPNVFAFYLMVILTLSLFLLGAKAFPISDRARRLLTLYIPVLLLLLLLTKTRSAWIGTAAIMLVYAVRFDRRYLIYIFAAPVVVLLVPALSERLADLQQGNYNEAYAKLNSFTWREILWHSALVWAHQKLWLGYGLESFGFYVAEFFPIPLENGTVDSHSVYVQLLFETGIVGLTAFLWMFVRLLASMTSLLRYGYPGTWMLIAMIASYLMMSYSDNMLYYLTPSWYFWYAMGTACAVLRARQIAARRAAIGPPYPSPAISAPVSLS
jgi:O-antigen ligase